MLGSFPATEMYLFISYLFISYLLVRGGGGKALTMCGVTTNSQHSLARSARHAASELVLANFRTGSGADVNRFGSCQGVLAPKVIQESCNFSHF